MPDPTADPILDAARDTVLAVGFRRTTVSEVARRVGVSRPTVYARYPDAAAIMRALMNREFTAVVEQADRETDDASTGRSRLIGGALRGADLIASHPLMVRVLEVDPELLMPYVTQRTGRVQRNALVVLAHRVELGQADGSVCAGSPPRIAGLIELALRGFVFAAHTFSPQERFAALGDLERMLERYLTP